MSKQDILNYFSDINYAYNDSTRLDTLNRMLDELIEEHASPWHRVEEEPPKPGCYLTASPFFHGDDYSWLYRLAWWTEHGLMDFVQDAEKESGWYIRKLGAKA